MQTCRHYRFRIPTADADALREADREPCEVCDNLPRRTQSLSLDWDPRTVNDTRSPSLANTSRVLGRMHQISRLDLGAFVRDVFKRPRPTLTHS